MIDNVDMTTDINKLSYLKKAQLYDQLIDLDIQERKSIPTTIAKYAHIICNPKNPYNKAFLDRFPE